MAAMAERTQDLGNRSNISVPESWEQLAPETKVLDTQTDPCDPVETALSTMEAASDAVTWVKNHWELSVQEPNAHCEAVASEAETLFEKAFIAAQLREDGHAYVLKGTEDFMARDLVAPKTYEQALNDKTAPRKRIEARHSPERERSNMTLGQVQDPVSGTERHRWDLDWTRHPDPWTGSTFAVHGTDARDLETLLPLETADNQW